MTIIGTSSTPNAAEATIRRRRWCGPIDPDVTRLLIIAVSLFCLMSLLCPGRFLTLRNFVSMSYQFPELGLFAVAVMLSLITGGIDLSVVSVANLAGILAALLLTRMIPPEATGVVWAAWIGGSFLVAAGTGVLCGLINGWLIAWAGITPILATLGTMQLFAGLAFVITQGSAVSGFPDQFLFLGNGTMAEIPVPLLLFLALALAVGFLLTRTRFGVRLYLLGTNETAARYSGIAVRSILIRAYLTSGLLSALAGILMIARTNSAKADYGSSYLLQAVLVAILGGVNPKGGFGTVTGLVLAVVSLQFLSSGFSMLRFSNFTKEFTWGALLLAVMVLNYFFRKRRA